MKQLTFNETIKVLIAAIDDVKAGNHTSACAGILAINRYGNPEAVKAAIKQQPGVEDFLNTLEVIK